MQLPRTRPALRFGLLGAVVTTALLALDFWLHLEHRSGGPELLVVAGRIVLILACCVPPVLGYLAARQSGRTSSGIKAGALALALPTALDFIAANVQTPIRGGSQGTVIAGWCIGLLLVTAAGALAGVVLSLPGALVGRARYRREHPELTSVPELTSAPGLRPTRARRRTLTDWIASFSVVLSLLAALELIGVVPFHAEQWAAGALGPSERALIAAGGLVVGFAVFRVGSAHRWLGSFADGLAVTCLCISVDLGAALLIGPLAGLYNIVAVTSFLAIVFYMWRWANRPLPSSRVPKANVPHAGVSDEVPAVFRSDGQSVVVYPSRRKLAWQAAVWVCLAGGALAFTLLDPSAMNPIVGWGIVLLAALYGVIPSVLRLFHSWPVLIFDSDGITDLASGLVFGCGLIRWHEVASFYLQRTTRGRLRARFVIVPQYYDQLMQRQPLLKRLFVLGVSPFANGRIVISSGLLPDSPAQFFERVGEFVASHAPAGYFERAGPPHEGDEDSL